jgi:hypothetical protein
MGRLKIPEASTSGSVFWESIKYDENKCISIQEYKISSFMIFRSIKG